LLGTLVGEDILSNELFSEVSLIIRSSSGVTGLIHPFCLCVMPKSRMHISFPLHHVTFNDTVLRHSYTFTYLLCENLQAVQFKDKLGFEKSHFVVKLPKET
jgi:hypothetical protein